MDCLKSFVDRLDYVCACNTSIQPWVVMGPNTGKAINVKHIDKALGTYGHR